MLYKEADTDLNELAIAIEKLKEKLQICRIQAELKHFIPELKKRLEIHLQLLEKLEGDSITEAKKKKKEQIERDLEEFEKQKKRKEIEEETDKKKL